MRAARAQLPPLPGDDAVVSARNAFAAGDLGRLDGIAASIELGHPLRQHVDAWRLRLHVLHFNHALRAESEGEAVLVASLAARLGCELHTRTAEAGGWHAAGLPVVFAES
jgi:hypothetical protein